MPRLSPWRRWCPGAGPAAQSAEHRPRREAAPRPGHQPHDRRHPRRHAKPVSIPRAAARPRYGAVRESPLQCQRHQRLCAHGRPVGAVVRLAGAVAMALAGGVVARTSFRSPSNPANRSRWDSRSWPRRRPTRAISACGATWPAAGSRATTAAPGSCCCSATAWNNAPAASPCARASSFGSAPRCSASTPAANGPCRSPGRRALELRRATLLRGGQAQAPCADARIAGRLGAAWDRWVPQALTMARPASRASGQGACAWPPRSSVAPS